MSVGRTVCRSGVTSLQADPAREVCLLEVGLCLKLFPSPHPFLCNIGHKLDSLLEQVHQRTRLFSPMGRQEGLEIDANMAEIQALKRPLPAHDPFPFHI